MKTITLLVLMAIPIISYSQTLDGFFGFRFGCSMDSVKKEMLIKPGCSLIDKYSSENMLAFEGMKFAGRDATYMIFGFINNKFHTGSVLISPNLKSKIIELYSDIQGELNEKYYKTTKVYENYTSPYEKGDGYYETAIKLGKADFSSFWKFVNPKSNKEDQKNSISLKITPTLNVSIKYQDGILIDEAVDKSKAKNFKDY